MSKKSGLGSRVRPLEPADKYLQGVLGPQEVLPGRVLTAPATPTRPEPAAVEAPGEAPPWEGQPDSGRMVPKTWHLPADLAKRFDSFVIQKCPPGTRGVKVVRQILDEFLKKHGF